MELSEHEELRRNLTFSPPHYIKVVITDGETEGLLVGRVAFAIHTLAKGSLQRLKTTGCGFGSMLCFSEWEFLCRTILDRTIKEKPRRHSECSD